MAYTVDEESLSGHEMAYAIMVLQGLGNLFPWNAFITAAHYFAMRFCDSSFESNFENFFSIATNMSQMIGLVVSIHYLQHSSLKYRVLFPLLTCAGIMALTTTLVTVKVNAVLLFVISLLSCCIVGLSTAFAGGGLFGLAGLLPPVYTGALMTGQAAGGFTVSVASLLTIWLGPGNDVCTDDDGDDGECENSIDYSALAFFCISCAVLGTCVISFLALITLPFTRYYEERAEKDKLRGPSIVDDVKDPLLHDTGHISHLLHADPDEDSDIAALLTDKEWSATGNVLPTLKKIRVASVSVFLVFVETLALFPSITVKISSQRECDANASRFNNDLFVPFMFVLFNGGDLLGRIISGKTRLGVTVRNLLPLVLARFIFFPLFLLCNVTDSQLPVVFESDIWPCLFMILFGVSSGFLANVSMMVGPTLVSPRNAALAGNMMILSLAVGLFTGSLASFVLLYISQGSF